MNRQDRNSAPAELRTNACGWWSPTHSHPTLEVPFEINLSLLLKLSHWERLRLDTDIPRGGMRSRIKERHLSDLEERGESGVKENNKEIHNSV